MPIDIAITEPPYCAQLDGKTDDSEAWQKAFDDLVTYKGGRLLFNKPGESFVSRTITIPVRQEPPREISIVFEGLGTGYCSIRGQDLSASAPVFEWDNSDTESSIVSNFIWRGMTIRHNGGGTAIQHKSTGRRFKNCTFENLSLLQAGTVGGTQPTLNIEGVLHSTFRDLSLSGGSEGGRGLRIRGSHAFLENIYVPQKSNAPSQFLDLACGNSRICHLRTEGGNSSIADYWIHDCATVDIQNVHSEGDTSQDIIRIENCEGITLTSVGVANQAKGSVNEPVGLRFVNSRYCTLIGSALGARTDPGGYALVFDEQSNHNTVIATRIVQTNFTNFPEQVLDKGIGNRWCIVDKSESANGTFFLMPHWPKTECEQSAT